MSKLKRGKEVLVLLKDELEMKAAWRAQKADQYPWDTRNHAAVQLLTHLAATCKDVSPATAARYAALYGDYLALVEGFFARTLDHGEDRFDGMEPDQRKYWERSENLGDQREAAMQGAGFYYKWRDAEEYITSLIECATATEQA
jgi:hypothetical protein